jgi:hypothetical protein
MPDAQPTGFRPAAEPEPIELTAPAAGTDEGNAEPGVSPSRRRRIVMGAVAALALAGAVMGGTTGWRVVQQKDATLTMPDRVAGLARDDRDAARETADYLRGALAAEVDLGESVGAVYADPADTGRSVLIFGGTALLWQPENDLDRAFDVLSDDSGEVAGVRTFSPGGLGGYLKCGATDGPDGEMAVCGWADHGSLALGMFPNRTADESTALLREIRQAVQSRA